MAASQRFSYINPEKAGFEQVFGEEINPYAVGHKINHPPPNTGSNVALVDIFIPKRFIVQLSKQILSTAFDEILALHR